MNAEEGRWNRQAHGRGRRLERARAALGERLRGRRVGADDAGTLLAALLEPGDRVCLEGNNQKQADFLARVLAGLDPSRVHGLHMVQSVLALPEHLDLFEKGLAATDRKLVPYGALVATFHTGLGCLLGPSLLFFAVKAIVH